MDVTTLRIALAITACMLVVLFHAAAYRPTKAPFARWWIVSLVLFSLSSLAYVANGTAWQGVFNPLGNGLAVAGVQAAWCAARSLRFRQVRTRWLSICPAVATLAGAVDHPGTDVWAGGLPLLLLVAVGFGATSVELVLARRSWKERGYCPRIGEHTLLTLLAALAGASASTALYYGARAVAFAAVGPLDSRFLTWFGGAPTTLLLIVQLSTVSFSMSALSAQQQLVDLSFRATYDQLTGLLRPQEFRREAASALPHVAREGETTVLVMADLDHFKKINDDLGHAAGDHVLRAFGRAADGLFSASGICGRLGGEEFCLLFAVRSLEEAEAVLDHLVATFQRSVTLADGRTPTVSLGLTVAGDDDDLAQLIERADRALYRAKYEGRARLVLG